jgi:hypothetical protein
LLKVAKQKAPKLLDTPTILNICKLVKFFFQDWVEAFIPSAPVILAANGSQPCPLRDEISYSQVDSATIHPKMEMVSLGSSVSQIEGTIKPQWHLFLSRDLSHMRDPTWLTHQGGKRDNCSSQIGHSEMWSNFKLDCCRIVVLLQGVSKSKLWRETLTLAEIPAVNKLMYPEWEE